MSSPLVQQRGMRRASLCRRYCLPALSRPHDDCLTTARRRGRVEVEVELEVVIEGEVEVLEREERDKGEEIKNNSNKGRKQRVQAPNT